MQILIGCDPEAFLADSTGSIINAHGFIPGTKEEPHKVKCGAVQIDGMALEFNTDPAATAEEFVHNIRTVQWELQKMLPKGYSVVYKPAHVFSPEYMAEQPKESLELGCDPDYNAYLRGINPTPDAAGTLRTAAGHVHLGWTQNEDMDNWYFNLCCDMVKVLDWGLGAQCFVWDRDSQRKALYGKAGAFRPKPYGLEYRTPNNCWLSTDERITTVFNHASWVVTFFQKHGGRLDSYMARHMENIINGAKASDMSLIRSHLEDVRTWISRFN